MRNMLSVYVVQLRVCVVNECFMRMTLYKDCIIGHNKFILIQPMNVISLYYSYNNGQKFVSNSSPTVEQIKLSTTQDINDTPIVLRKKKRKKSSLKYQDLLLV